MIFVDAAKNTLNMIFADFHENLMGRKEMASISKLMRFFNYLIYQMASKKRAGIYDLITLQVQVRMSFTLVNVIS